MKIRQEAARYATLALGAAILAFGLYNVHSQSHITEGGVLGMTLLMEHWLGVSPAVSEVVLDGICYALGLRYLGKAFLPHALSATGCFALFYALNERIGPLLPNVSCSLPAAYTATSFIVASDTRPCASVTVSSMQRSPGVWYTSRMHPPSSLTTAALSPNAQSYV